jgi:predicted pyridoxine 5'-phosphate oxidase superfamily flavin-nucleotide-binding protein
MRAHFAAIAFTDAVKAEQVRIGSRAAYARAEGAAAMAAADPRLGEAEAAFLAERESLYIATVSETGWPYIQHRGGPPGFVRVVEDGAAIAFADVAGNRQHITVGNLRGEARVALFFMDYLRRRRLKLLGCATALPAEAVPGLITSPGRPAERAFLVRIEGYDWNCPQHIPRLLPEAAVRAALEEAGARIASLEAENAALRAASAAAA